MQKPQNPFDREQLVFIAECILSAARDRWEGEELRPKEQTSYTTGALEGAGMALATLAAQIRGSGYGIMDALALAMSFDDLISVAMLPPEVIRQAAEAFVDAVFLD